MCEGEQCVLSCRVHALLPCGAAAPFVGRAELPERHRGVRAAALGSGASTGHLPCPAGECFFGSDSQGNGKMLLCLCFSLFFFYCLFARKLMELGQVKLLLVVQRNCNGHDGASLIMAIF